MCDCLASVALWLVMFLVPKSPPLIIREILPNPKPIPGVTNHLAFLLFVPIRTFSSLCEIAFRMYIYFKVTNFTNVLISTSTIIILILTYVLQSVLSFIFYVFQFNISLLTIPSAISLLFRSFFVPANILVSHDGITQIFINNLQDLHQDFKDFMTSMTNVGRASWHFLQSIKNLFNSNQVAPQEIELGSISSSE